MSDHKIYMASLIAEMQKADKDVQPFRDEFRSNILDTVRWRKERAAEFPSDSRNTDAIDKLGVIAESTKYIDRNRVFFYKTFGDHQIIGPKMISVQSELLAGVGFRNSIQDANSLIDAVLDEAYKLSDELASEDDQ